MLPPADFIFERKLCNTASCLEMIWDGPVNSPFWIEIKTYWRISVYPKQVYKIKLTSSVGRGKDYLESTGDSWDPKKCLLGGSLGSKIRSEIIFSAKLVKLSDNFWSVRVQFNNKSRNNRGEDQEILRAQLWDVLWAVRGSAGCWYRHHERLTWDREHPCQCPLQGDRQGRPRKCWLCAEVPHNSLGRNPECRRICYFGISWTGRCQV